MANMNDARINLVSEDILEGRQKERFTVRVKVVSLVAIVFFLVISAGLIFIYFWYQSKLTAVSEQRQFLESSIQSNKAVEQSVGDLKRRAAVFGSLYDVRLPYSDITSNLANLLPQEVLLESLLFHSDSVILNGETSSYASLARFIKEGNGAVAEKQSSFPFSSVILKQAGLDTQTGKITFSIALELAKAKKELVAPQEPEPFL